MKFIFSLIVASSLLTGCFDSGGGSTSSITVLKDVFIQCTVGQVNNCDSSVSSNLNKDIFIGLIFDNEQTCPSYLATIPAGQFSQYFDITAIGKTTNNSGTLGALLKNKWVDFAGGPVNSVKSSMSKITVCAFMDLNGDGLATLNEPFFDSAYSLNNLDELELIIWDTF